MKKVNIVVNTKVLLSSLKRFKVPVKYNKSKSHSSKIELTITDGKLSLAVPGAIESLSAKTIGTAKASLSFLHFFDIIKSIKKSTVEIIIKENEISIDITTINAKTTFFENDAILRTIVLPMNYTDDDLIKLLVEGYTSEELEFNNLTKKINAALKRQEALKLKEKQNLLYPGNSLFSDLNE